VTSGRDPDRYPSREVVAVVWRQGNHMTVTYEDGSTDVAVAAPDVAQLIAEDAELILGSSPEGQLRWEQPAP
jgi:hypothetical protein